MITSYRNHVESVFDGSADSAMRNANSALKKILKDNPVPGETGPVVYLLDMTQKQYVIVGKGVSRLLGYRPDYFLKGGLEAGISQWKREDFELMNNKMFPEWMRIIAEHREIPISDLIFSASYDLRQNDGTYKKVLDRFSMITDASNAVPFGVIGTLTDIMHFNTDKSRINTVEQAGESQTRLLYRKVYFHNELCARITKKEREILGRLADGLSSRQIADKLFLSENTVVNHRKNMLRKTNTKNVAELIRYAICTGII